MNLDRYITGGCHQIFFIHIIVAIRLRFSKRVKLNAGEIVRTDGTKVLLDRLARNTDNNWLIAPVVVAFSAIYHTGDACQ